LQAGGKKKVLKAIVVHVDHRHSATIIDIGVGDEIVAEFFLNGRSEINTGAFGGEAFELGSRRDGGFRLLAGMQTRVGGAGNAKEQTGKDLWFHDHWIEGRK